MEMLLKRDGVWNAITKDRPENNADEWDKADEKAHSTISLCVEDNQIHHIRNTKNAKEAWKVLKDFHERDSPGTKVRILREIMRQRATEETDMEIHVNHMNELFQKLLALGGNFSPEFFMSATLLGSLPRSYDGLITALEVYDEEKLKPELVRAKITEEHRRRKDRDVSKNIVCDANALKVTNNGSHTTKKMVSCYFCKKSGHFRNKCNEYAKWKARQNNVVNKSKANIVEQRNIDQFLFIVGTCPSEWIIDSGATCHICSRREVFIEFDGLHTENVSLANGQQIKSSGKGSVVVHFMNKDGIPSNVKIEDVLYIPEIGGNLISVKRLTEKGLNVIFKEDACEIWSSDNKYQIAIAEIVNNLYRMRVANNNINLVANKQNVCIHEWHRILGHRSIDAVKNISKEGLVDGMKLAGCKSNCIHAAECDVCIKGKLTRMSFPKESKNCSSKILDLIHSDICGPMQTTTFGGKRYVLTFIDDFSRYTSVYLLKEKSETFQRFKEFHQLVQNKFGTKIKCIRTDRGGEYISKEFVQYLNINGVKIHRTAPYSPQQNGVAERKNRTLMEMARCMLLDAKLENRYWGEAIVMANCLQNSLPWKAVSRTPFEIWHGRKPFYENLKRFGTKCFVRIQDAQRQKLDLKAEEAIFLGFDSESKAYRCFVPAKQKVVISRDVKFIDDHDIVSKWNLPAKHVDNHREDIAMKTRPESYIYFDSDDYGTADDINQSNDMLNNDTIAEESIENDAPVNNSLLELPRQSNRPNKGIRPIRLIEEISVVVNGEPSNFNEAVSCIEKDNWIVAMEEEYASQIKNETWKLVDLPENTNLIGCKWVYKLKTTASGQIQKYKARLVAQGFNQKFGVDYDQVFAPVARHATFRILLSIAASRKMTINHFDAKTAFLNGDLEEEIYMRQPPGFITEGNEDKVCLLNKSIYGLKQSARVWNDKLHNVLISAGVMQSKADNCLYTYHGKDGFLFILIYVDDILVIYNNKECGDKIEKALCLNFDIDNLGLISNYLGMRITKDKKCYLLDQEKYILNVAARFNLENSKPTDIPLSPSYHKETDEEKLPSNVKYRAAIGCLLYISTNTRPDIAAGVAILSQKVANPTQSDWNEVKKLIRYLKGTSKLRLKLGDSEMSEELIGYADANWAEDRQTRKSNSGHIFLLNGAISWSCKRQDCVALSSTEAEFIALSECCKEAIWIQRILYDLKWEGDQSTKIFEDNQSVIKMIINEKFSNRSKHIDTKVHFVKEYVDKNLIKIEYCPTEEMLADMFTKGLAKAKFQSFRDK